MWVCEDGVRRLLLSDDDLWWGPDGRVSVRSTGTPGVRVYDPSARGFTGLGLASGCPSASGSGAAVGAVPSATSVDVVVKETRPAGAVPAGYGRYEGRASAPAPGVFDRYAAVYRLDLPEWAADAARDPLLEIDAITVVGRVEAVERA